ncbi:MAG: hypothetical protein KAI55_03515 [Candidatus Aenigmarchaeota archaeon]|nr:hypothetical protein [Candidatus Aenigmarchaeota archaeon]
MFIPALVDFGASPTLTKYIAEFLARKEKEKINHIIRFFFSVKFTASFIARGLAYLFRSEIASVFLKDATLEYLAVFSIFDLSNRLLQDFRSSNC